MRLWLSVFHNKHVLFCTVVEIPSRGGEKFEMFHTYRSVKKNVNAGEVLLCFAYISSWARKSNVQIDVSDSTQKGSYRKQMARQQCLGETVWAYVSGVTEFFDRQDPAPWIDERVAPGKKLPRHRLWWSLYKTWLLCVVRKLVVPTIWGR